MKVPRRLAPWFLLPLLFLALLAGCRSAEPNPPDTVASVDLARYMGRWYEIASYPAPFQAGCTGTMAEYTLRNDGRVRVVNRCRDRRLDGPVRQAEGVARVADPRTGARLKVSFFWPFEGDYWIIDLDPDYRWAVVGEPGRRYLWVLSRTPTLDEAVWHAILARLPDKGYDPSRLVRTPQAAVEMGTGSAGT